MASTAAGKQRIPKVAKVGGEEGGGDPPGIPGNPPETPRSPLAPGRRVVASSGPAARNEAPEEMGRLGAALGNVIRAPLCACLAGEKQGTRRSSDHSGAASERGKGEGARASPTATTAEDHRC